MFYTAMISLYTYAYNNIMYNNILCVYEWSVNVGRDGVVCRQYYIRTLCSSSEIESALGHTMVLVINMRAPARCSACIITAVVVYMCYDGGRTISIYI